MWTPFRNVWAFSYVQILKKYKQLSQESVDDLSYKIIKETFETNEVPYKFSIDIKSIDKSSIEFFNSAGNIPSVVHSMAFRRRRTEFRKRVDYMALSYYVEGWPVGNIVDMVISDLYSTKGYSSISPESLMFYLNMFWDITGDINEMEDYFKMCSADSMELDIIRGNIRPDALKLTLGIYPTSTHSVLMKSYGLMVGMLESSLSDMIKRKRTKAAKNIQDDSGKESEDANKDSSFESESVRRWVETTLKVSDYISKNSPPKLEDPEENVIYKGLEIEKNPNLYIADKREVNNDNV